MVNKKIKKAILTMFEPRYYTITKVYDAEEYYLFTIRRIDADSGASLDPFYLINKKTLEIRGFLPHQNSLLYKKAIKNSVGWR